jgi:type I restriction enzyme S subunit
MEYKNTAIGEIPVEWNLRQLQDIFEVKTGTTPSTKNSEYWENGNIIWVTPTDMSKIEGITIADSDRKVTNKALKEVNLNLMPKNSIILSTRAPVGYVALNSEKITFNQGCKGLIPKDSDMIDSLFYSYYLVSQKNRLQNLSGGSTFKELAKDTLIKIDLPVPSFPEQQKIAEILSTTDQAVQKSNEIIAKSERIKKGMLYTLLTKGIGHEEFKVTPIGMMPTDWKIVKLANICEFFDQMRIPVKKQDRIKRNGIYPYYGAQGIIDWIDDYIFDGDFILLAEDGANLTSRRLPIANKVSGKFWVNNHAHILKPNKDVNADFLFYILNQINIRIYVTGSAQPKLNQATAKKIKLPLPGNLEQEKIAIILTKIDELHGNEIKRKEKLQKVKNGLMNDLLTGRKRVEVNN